MGGEVEPRGERSRGERETLSVPEADLKNPDTFDAREKALKTKTEVANPFWERRGTKGNGRDRDTGPKRGEPAGQRWREKLG